MTESYITPNALDKAKRHGIAGRISNLQKRWQKMELSDIYDQLKDDFVERSLFAKVRIDNFRVIITPISKSGVDLICILEIIGRKDKDYRTFLDSPDEVGNDLMEKFVGWNEINKIVKNFKTKHPLKTIPKLPGSLTGWLFPLQTGNQDQYIVCESEEWITSITNDVEELPYYHQLLEDILNYAESDNLGTQIDQEGFIWKVKDKTGNFNIYYSIARTDIVVVYLINLLPKNSDASESEIIQQNRWLYQIPDNCSSFDWIMQHARRCYPAYILADNKIWRAIEKSWIDKKKQDVANLALSTEEAQLLATVRGALFSSLPLFINGRAGSGKSTLLTYLYLDYINKKNQRVDEQKLDGDILLLTYNQRLLDETKSNIIQVWNSRAEYLANRSSPQHGEGDIMELVSSLKPFQEFLLSLVPENDLLKFSKNQYIDYAKFEQWYLGRNIPESERDLVLKDHKTKQRLTPGFCWHVIRTYIKGYSSLNYLSPDDYIEKVSPKQQSVTEVKYQDVYVNVWEKWYKRISAEQNLWDDQDLVRQILKNRWYKNIYAVLFCDEAQDFTRIEAEFILKLLIYLDYDLASFSNRIRLPLVMAGDPFQTLTPTGFRWDDLKTYFHAQIINHLDRYNRGLVKIEYKELSYNYRSSAPIVNLSNVILLWRTILFGLSNITPQIMWKNDPRNLSPRIFILGENLKEEDFKLLANNALILIPCEPSQEKDYVAGRPLLSQLEEKNFAILSPASFKGQDYPKVILYNFGEKCPESIIQYFEELELDEKQLPTDSDALIEQEYFLNKLYVAITRAMQELIIVDSEIGNAQFWSKIGPITEKIKKMLGKGDTSRIWKDTYYDVSIGDIELELTPKESGEDPILLASKLFEVGRIQKDVNVLMDASKLFKKIGLNKDSILAEAYALMYDRDFERAGNLFASVDKNDLAEECYWKGNCWKILIDWFSKRKTLNPLHERISQILVYDNSDVTSSLDLMRYLSEDLKQQLPFLESQFQTGVLKAINTIVTQNIGAESWLLISEVVKRLTPLYLVIGYDKIGMIYFRAKEYELAINAWENILNRHSIPAEYFLAKAEITDWPEKGIWLERSKTYQPIIDHYCSIDLKKVKQEEVLLFARAQRGNNDTLGGIKTLAENNNIGLANSWFTEWFSNIEKGTFEHDESVHNIIHLIISKDAFDNVIKIIQIIGKKWKLEETLNVMTKFIRVLAKRHEWNSIMRLTLPMGSPLIVYSPYSFDFLTTEGSIRLRAVAIKEMANRLKPKDEDIYKYIEYLNIFSQSGIAKWKNYVDPGDVAKLAKILYPEQEFVRFCNDLLSSGNLSKNQEARVRNHIKEYLNDPSSIIEEDQPKKVTVKWVSPNCRLESGDIDFTINCKDGEVNIFGDLDYNRNDNSDIVEFDIPIWNVTGKLIKGSAINLRVGDVEYIFSL